MVITAAPPATFPVPASAPTMPAAAGPRLIPFRKVFRERWLWLTCTVALLILVLAYQSFPRYLAIFDTSISNEYIPTYSYTADLMHLGDGWGPPRPISPQEKGHPNSDGSFSVPISPLYTTGSGDLQLYNFGYPLGTGTYNLEVEVSANVPMSFTVSIGSQVVGMYAAQNEGYRPFVTIPAAAFLAAGPDPTITFAITHSAPATPESGTPNLDIPLLYLHAPSSFVLVIPPLLLLLWVLPFTMLCYFVVRKTRSPAHRAISLAILSLVPLCCLLLFTLNLDRRRDIGSNLLWPLLLALLVVILSWRRELANWLLHLRYPDDERFRTA
ncbi:MAG: hypothetical protein DLM69_04030 [Candidatus Chloroheliales bacterium]|nr:MAG: hypothetical protein DLM69_04030 [Chloroflexota bacterium]